MPLLNKKQFIGNVGEGRRTLEELSHIKTSPAVNGNKHATFLEWKQRTGDSRVTTAWSDSSSLMLFLFLYLI